MAPARESLPTARNTRGSERGRKLCAMTVDNPFAAADVGAIYDHGRPFHHPRTLAHIRTLVGDAPLDSALDVACGTGMSTVALAEYAPRVVGLDISPEMMR